MFNSGLMYSVVYLKTPLRVQQASQSFQIQTSDSSYPSPILPNLLHFCRWYHYPIRPKAIGVISDSSLSLISPTQPIRESCRFSCHIS